MNTYYEILFQLNVFHRYFRDDDNNRCKALVFEPTAECKVKLRDHRLLFKNTENGFIIIAEKMLTGGTETNPVLAPVIKPEPGTIFNFFIRSSRADFLNITDANLPAFEGGKKFYFRNEPANPTITAVRPQAPEGDNLWLTNGTTVSSITIHNLTMLNNALRIAPAVFNAPVQAGINPFRLVLRDPANTIIADKFIPRNRLNQIVAETVLLSSDPFEENIYTLEQVNAGGVILASEKYFLTPQSSSDAVGIFQLDYNTVLDGTGATEFQFIVDLQTRFVHWSYKIQVDQYTDPLDVVNNYNPDDLRLNTLANNVPVLGLFNKVKDLGPPIMLSFDSTALIPFKEEAYAGVHLVDKDDLAKFIIPHLPNPDPMILKDAGGGNYKSEIYLKIK